MTAILAGVICFALAFAAWRWGLGNRNWLEGALAASVLTGVVLCALWFVQGVLQARARATEHRADVVSSGIRARAAPAENR